MNTKPSSPSSSLSEALSRRHFSKLLATSALGTLVAPAFLRGQNLNSKLSIAIIGAGGRGGSNMGDVGQSENIVALCDVAEAALDSAQKKARTSRRFGPLAEFRSGTAACSSSARMGTCCSPVTTSTRAGSWRRVASVHCPALW